MTTQPQLLHIPLDKGDVVYTPEWVAKDMVKYFNPGGSILEPCSGDGVFLKYLPDNTKWCEIQRGRDFFAWHKRVDWLFGNPPYGIYSKWLDHSMNIASDIVYLLPVNKAFNSWAMINRVNDWGGIAAIRVYGAGARLGFPIGYAIGAIHYQKGYTGKIDFTMGVDKELYS